VGFDVRNLSADAERRALMRHPIFGQRDTGLGGAFNRKHGSLGRGINP